MLAVGFHSERSATSAPELSPNILEAPRCVRKRPNVLDLAVDAEVIARWSTQPAATPIGHNDRDVVTSSRTPKNPRSDWAAAWRWSLLQLPGKGTTIPPWDDSGCYLRPEAPCSPSSR